MIAGLEVYDRLGRLIMGAEDYNRYILGTIDLRGVYFGADHYQKKILEHEQTITVDCPQFDSHCKLVPLLDIGAQPYGQVNSYYAGQPNRYDIYMAKGNDRTITKDEWDKAAKQNVYKYFPVVKSYKTWGFGFSYIAAIMGEGTTQQGLNFWCPEPGKISYNTGGSMEANWLAYAQQDQSEYKEGDTYCGVSWLLMRCLILGRLE